MTDEYEDEHAASETFRNEARKAYLAAETIERAQKAATAAGLDPALRSNPKVRELIVASGHLIAGFHNDLTRAEELDLMDALQEELDLGGDASTLMAQARDWFAERESDVSGSPDAP